MKTMKETHGLITRKEAMEYLGLRYQGFLSLMANGANFGEIKIGKFFYYSKTAIDNWLKEKKKEAIIE